MMRPLVILGTGGNAFDILDVVDAINARAPTWEVIGYLDDARKPGTVHAGHEVLGPLASAGRMHGCDYINAIGSDRSYRLRPQLIAGLGLRREQFPTLVHPLASVSSRARLGNGVCVNYGVSVAGGVSIGDHVWLAPGSVIGHDAEIGACSMLCPAAVVSGFVRVGAGCYLGARSVLRGRVVLGEKALVGMGAVVLRDVAAGTTVVGNPARVLERPAVKVIIEVASYDQPSSPLALSKAV